MENHNGQEDQNKAPWTEEEDMVLVQLVEKIGAQKWTMISEYLPSRIGKQCRERWLTALDPSINKQQWTLKEDIDFLQKWLNVGNKWREIANLIDGRTES